jgi:hypothetical protein
MDRMGHELLQKIKVFKMSITHYFSWPVISYSGLYVQLIFLWEYDSRAILCILHMVEISKNVSKRLIRIQYIFIYVAILRVKTLAACCMLLSVPCLTYSPVMKVEVISFLETSGCLWAPHHNPKNCALHSLPKEPQIQHI